MRILWMKTELLHPTDKGGRIRTYNVLRRLRAHHRITYLTLDDGSASAVHRERAAEYCDDLVCVPFSRPSKRSPKIIPALLRSALGPLPFAIGAYQSAAMTQRVAELTSGGDIDVVVSDFLVSSINLPRAVRCPTILFQHNVEAQIWARRVEHAAGLTRLYVRAEAEKIAVYERAACRRFDRVLVVSDADQQTHAREYGVADPVVIPTGVDTEYFAPMNVAPDAKRIVFVGSMDWQPNDDGALFFIERVLPIVRRALPDVRVSIVGRNPSRRLEALAAGAGGVDVTGRVADVRPHIARAALSIVPLRIGGGTRLKIFEAMAMGRPVVSTSIGAEGLDVRSGEGLVIADDEASFAAAVARLIGTPAAAATLGQTAREVACRHSWRASVDRFNDALRELAPAAAQAAVA